MRTEENRLAWFEQQYAAVAYSPVNHTHATHSSQAHAETVIEFRRTRHSVHITTVPLNWPLPDASPDCRSTNTNSPPHETGRQILHIGVLDHRRTRYVKLPDDRGVIHPAPSSA